MITLPHCLAAYGVFLAAFLVGWARLCGANDQIDCMSHAEAMRRREGGHDAN